MLDQGPAMLIFWTVAIALAEAGFFLFFKTQDVLRRTFS